MTCPRCKSENEMDYSVLIHGFVCSEAKCGLELEMEHVDAELLLAECENIVGRRRNEEQVFA